MTARIVLAPKTTNEIRLLTFDFSSFLALAETISGSVASVAVWSGTDASPSSMLSGSSAVSGALVNQLMTGGVAGVLYVVSIVASTSLGQALTLSGFLAVTAPQP